MFKFELEDEVIVPISKEIAIIIGRAEYLNGDDNRYLLKYSAVTEGKAVDRWESELYLKEHIKADEQEGLNMRLGDKQELFMRLLPRLIDKAHELGFQIRGGDLYRDSRLHGSIGESKGYGHRNSCHKLKLAIDLNLFKDEKFITTTEGHKELGEWWEAQHELCKWGGRFNDGNHYSLTHTGYL